MVWGAITIDADISYVEKRIIRETVKNIAKLNEISKFVATFLQSSYIAIKISNMNHLHITVRHQKIDILAKVSALTWSKTFA